MNCKQGDLAVVIADDFEENVGTIVTIARRTTEEDSWWVDKEDWICTPLSVVIAYDNVEKTSWSSGLEDVALMDKHLRPIRNDPGQDQTLSWKDVPQEVKA